MSKKSKMRWRKSDTAELQRIINNFNNRLYRQQKNNPDADYLPQRMTKTQAIKSIETRADYKRLISSLEKFNAETAKMVKSDRGAVTTQWAIDVFKENERRVNAERAKLKKKLESKEVTFGGKKTGVKRAEMGSIKENAINPSNKNFKNMSQKEWDIASKLMDARLNESYQRDRQELWMRNYVKGLIRVGMPDDIVEMMGRISPSDFADVIDLDEMATIAFIYDPQQLEAIAEKIRDVWSNYDTGETVIDFDLAQIRQEIGEQDASGVVSRFVNAKQHNKSHYKYYKNRKR